MSKFFDIQSPCPSYRLPVRTALAAAIIAAALAMPMAAAAQDLSVGEIIVVGGIKDVAAVEFVSNQDETALPALPVVHEGAQEETANEEGSADAADSAVGADLGHRVEAQ